MSLVKINRTTMDRKARRAGLPKSVQNSPALSPSKIVPHKFFLLFFMIVDFNMRFKLKKFENLQKIV